MVSLHDKGWRQGTLVTATLPLVGVQLSDHGDVTTDIRTHHIWIVATQDCDLAGLDLFQTEDVVELRPVFDHEPPATWGIRSQKCLLIDNQYVEAQSRRTMISPGVLTSLLAAGVARYDNEVADDGSRKTAFKTWLGLRYDRPAVPSDYVALARHIAREVERQGKTYTTRVRDVLVQFQDGTPPIFSLYAIIIDAKDDLEITEWLTGTALRVPSELGVLGGITTGTDEYASLRLIETSFALDLSQITWRGTSLRREAGR